MKQRLLEAIYKKIDEDPNNENLQKQIMLLNRAHICTIHSFCLDVIRNNFFELGIPANFRVADESEIEIMKQEIIEEIFEEKYENQDEMFLKLLESYTTYKDDTPLKDIILNIYKFTRSLPKPEEWLEEKTQELNTNEDFEKTVWGKLLFEKSKETIEYIIKNLETAQKLVDNNIELVDFYTQISSDLTDIKQINCDDWNSIYNVASNKKWEAWSRKSKMSDESKSLKEKAKIYRDEAKGAFEEKIKKYVNCTSEEAKEELKHMYPIIKGIKELTIEFSQRFEKAKREKNIVDFPDIEHLALKLLVGRR